MGDQINPVFGILDTNTQVLHAIFGSHDMVKITGHDLQLWAEQAQAWNDACEVCDKSGNLLMCYGCNLTYHNRCLVHSTFGRPLEAHEELVCPACVAVEWAAYSQTSGDGGEGEGGVM